MDANEQEKVREVMSLLGRSRSERKLAALAANREKAAEVRRGAKDSEETRQRRAAAQAARRERERQEQAAPGVVEETKQKRPVGRPKKNALPVSEGSPESQDSTQAR